MSNAATKVSIISAALWEPVFVPSFGDGTPKIAGLSVATLLMIALRAVTSFLSSSHAVVSPVVTELGSIVRTSVPAPSAKTRPAEATAASHTDLFSLLSALIHFKLFLNVRS